MNWKSTRGQQWNKIQAWTLTLLIMQYGDILENKTFHPNISSLKTAIEE